MQTLSFTGYEYVGVGRTVLWDKKVAYLYIPHAAISIVVSFHLLLIALFRANLNLK